MQSGTAGTNVETRWSRRRRPGPLVRFTEIVASRRALTRVGNLPVSTTTFLPAAWICNGNEVGAWGRGEWHVRVPPTSFSGLGALLGKRGCVWHPVSGADSSSSPLCIDKFLFLTAPPLS